MVQCGDIIDQYRLTKFLGSGSYGVVFEAENLVSKQKYALKIIPLCGRAGERELRALRLYHNIGHPNLLTVHHSGIAGDYLFYTMELAEGKLADQHFSPAQLRAAAIKIADALASLHEHGLLHRDLKPDNLFFLNGEPLIGDIGLVTADCGASLTGTPGFLPPAVQKSGAALSEQSDLYALAMSFYCLLSGNPPGNYPKYDGTIEENAAILLQAVLDVCDNNGEIMSAAGFRDFLQKGPGRKTRRRSWGAYLLVFLLLIAAMGITTVVLVDKPAFLMSPGERMFYLVQKAGRYSSAEQSAIAKQKKVYGQLKTAARDEMEKRYPHRGNTTSVNAELERHRFYETLLKKMVYEQAEKSPDFRCFFILWNEAEQASLVLYKLNGHPEYADVLEESFQRWQKKYEEYCKMRNTLLKK